MINIKKKSLFESDLEDAINTYGVINKMVIAVKLPTGATELIINTEQLDTKVEYYKAAYDDDMRLKNNSQIQIIDWMFV